MRRKAPFFFLSSSNFFLWFSINCFDSRSQRILSSSFCVTKSCWSKSRSLSLLALSRWSSFCTLRATRSSASRLSFSSCSFLACMRAVLSIFLSSSSSSSSPTLSSAGAVAALFFLSWTLRASSCSLILFFSASSFSSFSFLFLSSSLFLCSSSLRCSSVRRRTSSSSFLRLSSSINLRAISLSTSSFLSSICCLLLIIILRSSSSDSLSCLKASAFCRLASCLRSVCTMARTPWRPLPNEVSCPRMRSLSKAWSP
mmetsp:Transcript_35982/g.91991  ORF Transcript_35982/g.91991 Transcript_35982/m.91991 type:complete len:256 (-) Transcript_35982:1648-2415(-)